MHLGEAFLKRKDKILLDEIGFGQVRDVEVAKIREAVERSDVCVRWLSDEYVCGIEIERCVCEIVEWEYVAPQ